MPAFTFPGLSTRKSPLGLSCSFNKGLCFWILLGFAYAAAPTFAEDVRDDMDASGAPIQAAPADPAIQRALAQISAERIQQIVEKLVSFHNRSTLSSVDTGLAPGQGVTAAADWIAAEFQRYADACGGCLDVKRDTFTQQPEPPPKGRIPLPTTITNVYAVLRGSDPSHASRMMLVTGHYDSRDTDIMDTRGGAPGANDDATGVAVSLECARVLSAAKVAGLRLPSTIVFAAVAGEEQGLNGSRHLAELAKSEGWHLEGVLNNDIVGGNTTPGDTLQDKSAVRVFSEGVPAAATPDEVKRIVALGLESDSPSRELARAITDVGRTYFRPANAVHGPDHSESHRLSGFQTVLIFRRDRYLRGGDHASFNQEGFAAVRFTEWREDFNHQHQNVRVENGVQYGDLLKYVDFNYVADVARLNAASLASLAAAPPPPQNVRIVTKDLDNNTTLHWSSGAGAAGTGYEVLWRETSAADWERYQAIGTGQGDGDGSVANFSYTVPVSKDNVIFGIRSVDAAGHRSPAVAPLPER
jgi:hypothetical protein